VAFLTDATVERFRVCTGTCDQQRITGPRDSVGKDQRVKTDVAEGLVRQEGQLAPIALIAISFSDLSSLYAVLMARGASRNAGSYLNSRAE
jgi:hypothetical protein